MSTLRVENLTKEYGDVTALDDVSFEIEDEFAVLLGESGAGKSTLLRCANGLTEPTTGGIHLDGEATKSCTVLAVQADVTDPESARRTVSPVVSAPAATRRTHAPADHGSRGFFDGTCETTGSSFDARRRSSPTASSSPWVRLSTGSPCTARQCRW